jgi:lysozyme
MAFNLGVPGLLKFKRTLAAIRGKEYDRAAAMMLDSRWATQVGMRAERLSKMMATGHIPPELI